MQRYSLKQRHERSQGRKYGTLLFLDDLYRLNLRLKALGMCLGELGDQSTN